MQQNLFHLFCGILFLPFLAVSAPVDQLRLVPWPKEIRMQEGALDLTGELVLEIGGADPALLVRQLNEELRNAGFAEPALRPGQGDLPYLRLAGNAGQGRVALPTFRAEATSEDYVLGLGQAGVEIRAPAPAGLFYGVQTLRQLIRANRDGSRLPALTIRDWPSLQWRAFQDDLTRGPSSTLAELQRETDLGAFFKHNTFTYYMEYQYAFSKHPKIGPKNGALTPAELKAWVEYGAPRHISILGNQQSFGHFTAILAHPEYAPLRETSYLLCPTNEGTYRLLDDLYSEVAPLLPFPYFNVCCDETFGLGTGPSKPVADKIGVGALYVRHIQRVRELVTGKYGKRMMMWGDIILNHPNHLSEIPRDVVMLTWGYDPRPNFEDQIRPFAKSGYEFVVCPGVNCWMRVLPDFQASVVNIQNFVRDGLKHGTRGMLNTSWDDDGENFNAPNWHGFAWGAECAWTGSQTSPEDFNRRLGGVLFGERGDRFGKAIAGLSRPGLGGLFNLDFWKTGQPLAPGPEAVKKQARHEQTLALVRDVLSSLEACQREAVENGDLLDFFIFGARRLELFYVRDLRRWDAAREYAAAWEKPAEVASRVQKARAILRQTRDDYAWLNSRFADLWRRENKEFALDWTLQRYQKEIARYDALLERLARAQETAGTGVALPPLKEFAPELSLP